MTDVDCLVLDSDIVIHLLKKQKQTVDLFVSLHEDGTEFLISPIVVAEVYAGAFRKEHVAIDAFFGLCRPLLLDEKTAKQAGIYAASTAMHK